MNRWAHKRSIRRRYNLTAQSYDQRYFAEQQIKYQAALNKLQIKQDDTILDVGCGTGLFFNHISDRAGSVVGLDISRGLLLQAKERAKAYSNVFVVLGDADHLPFADGFQRFRSRCYRICPNVETLQEPVVAKPDASIVVTALKRHFLETFANAEQAGLKLCTSRR